MIGHLLLATALPKLSGRFTPSIPDYLNDHIWELIMGGGEPAALALRTTYGLRAKTMRLFIRFSEGKKTVSDPAAFALPPTICRFYPNFLVVEYSPLQNIDVSIEYWVPQSNAISGRVTVSNKSNATRKICLEVCSLLTPVDGQGMTSTQMQLVNVLAGQTGGLFPVLFLTGGPAHGSGPHPSLFLDLDLGPGATRQLTWTQAATDTLQASFDLARQSAARPWEAERARLELLNSSQPSLFTPVIRIGCCFCIKQTAALGAVFSTHRITNRHGVARSITLFAPKAMAESTPPPGMDNLRWSLLSVGVRLPHSRAGSAQTPCHPQKSSIDGKPVWRSTWTLPRHAATLNLAWKLY